MRLLLLLPSNVVDRLSLYVVVVVVVVTAVPTVIQRPLYVPHIFGYFFVSICGWVTLEQVDVAVGVVPVVSFDYKKKCPPLALIIPATIFVRRPPSFFFCVVLVASQVFGSRLHHSGSKSVVSDNETAPMYLVHTVHSIRVHRITFDGCGCGYGCGCSCSCGCCCCG